MIKLFNKKATSDPLIGGVFTVILTIALLPMLKQLIENSTLTGIELTLLSITSLLIILAIVFINWDLIKK